MRALIGLVVLGTLFVMAASWQSRMTSELRGTDPSDTTWPTRPTGEEGWSRLVLGRPSGADPLLVVESVAPTTTFSPAGVPRPVTSRRNRHPASAGDRVHRVRPNEVLGKICQEHYDVRPLAAVVEAVATYNDLASPDDIREGELLLPDPAVLFRERARR